MAVALVLCIVTTVVHFRAWQYAPTAGSLASLGNPKCDGVLPGSMKDGLSVGEVNCLVQQTMRLRLNQAQIRRWNG